MSSDSPWTSRTQALAVNTELKDVIKPRSFHKGGNGARFSEFESGELPATQLQSTVFSAHLQMTFTMY